MGYLLYVFNLTLGTLQKLTWKRTMEPLHMYCVLHIGCADAMLVAVSML